MRCCSGAFAAGIGAPHAGPDDRDRPSTAVERADVCSCVDAGREPADDGVPGVDEPGGDVARVGEPGIRSPTGADDGHGPLVGIGQRAAHEQQRRTVVDAAQVLRILLVEDGQGGDALGVPTVDLDDDRIQVGLPAVGRREQRRASSSAGAPSSRTASALPRASTISA